MVYPVCRHVACACNEPSKHTPPQCVFPEGYVLEHMPSLGLIK
jgi:hypothetical protein